MTLPEITSKLRVVIEEETSNMSDRMALAAAVVALTVLAEQCEERLVSLVVKSKKAAEAEFAKTFGERDDCEHTG